MNGRIIRQISNQYLVQLETQEIISCIALGKLRLGLSPKVGDNVKVIKNKEKYCIEHIFPRINDLIRPNICNVDQVFILMSVKAPKFSNKLLDRMLAIITYFKVKPIIVFTKMDLINDEMDIEIQKYRSIGYDVVISGENFDLSLLKNMLKNKVSVFTGNSGVGKSSLLNRLDASLNLKTQITSKALGRGKHTTRHTELFNLCGGLVADTPGFSSLDFFDMNEYDVKEAFIEFSKYICKYHDCLHENEPDCEVKKHIHQIYEARYNNYLDILSKVRGNKK